MKGALTRALGGLVIALAVGVSAAPRFLFPVCGAGHLGLLGEYEPHMRCFWFGQAEIFLGALVGLAGLTLILRPTADVRFGAGMMLVGLGLTILLVSLNGIIGSTCGHAHSLCQVGTKPAERMAGGFVMLTGLTALVSSWRKA